MGHLSLSHPRIYRSLYIPGGCLGFLPSTVITLNFKNFAVIKWDLFFFGWGDQISCKYMVQGLGWCRVSNDPCRTKEEKTVPPAKQLGVQKEKLPNLQSINQFVVKTYHFLDFLHNKKVLQTKKIEISRILDPFLLARTGWVLHHRGFSG